jgi:type II secretory pathway pseudopilin PulG
VISNIITIIVAIASSAGFWGLLQYIFDQRAKQRQTQIEDLKDMIQNVGEKLDINEEITVSFARARLNNMCNKYLRDGYIPKEDYVAFIMLGESYVKHHNSEVALRFEQCRDLPQE